MEYEEIMEAMQDGVITTEDGCLVELDGVCPHGYESPAILAGII